MRLPHAPDEKFIGLFLDPLLLLGGWAVIANVLCALNFNVSFELIFTPSALTGHLPRIRGGVWGGVNQSTEHILCKVFVFHIRRNELTFSSEIIRAHDEPRKSEAEA